MTHQETEILFERFLLGETNEVENARVQELILKPEYRNQLEFQRAVINQIRQKSRDELKSMLTSFDKDIEEEIAKDPMREVKIIPFYQTPVFRLAASIALILALGAIVWWSVKDNAPVYTGGDSTNIKKDSNIKYQHEKAPEQIVEKKIIKPGKTVYPDAIKMFDTEDISFGFGKGNKESATIPFIVISGEKPEYQFEDTLKVYLPENSGGFKKQYLLHDIAQENHYLILDNKKYMVIKGSKIRRPLKAIE